MVSALDAYEKWANESKSCNNKLNNSHFISLAGIKVCIHLHRPALSNAFLMGISHLLIDPCVPDYEIDVWDLKDGKHTFPKFDYGIEDVKVRGEIPLYCADGVDFAYYAHARMIHTLNENTKHGVVALVDGDSLPSFEIACPFRGIFSWILRSNGLALIHAAALADSGGNGCLVIGKSGAGKSTTAISCFLSGMKYIGDDLCALGLNQGSIHVYSIYCSGKTYKTEWSYIPELSSKAFQHKSDEYEKELYFFSNDKNNICLEAKLKTIFVPLKEQSSKSRPTIAELIAITVNSTRELLPGAGFESLALICKAFKNSEIKYLNLTEDRVCPISEI